jgi:hypothetical protein
MAQVAPTRKRALKNDAAHTLGYVQGDALNDDSAE